MKTESRSERRWKKDPVYLEEIGDLGIGEVLSPGQQRYHEDLFLGRYVKDDLIDMFRDAGIIDALEAKGYNNLLFKLGRDDQFTSRIFVNFDRDSKDTRLIELVVKEAVFRPWKVFVKGFEWESLSILKIEWLALQDIKGEFSEKKPRLPGQIYPGLGLLRNIQDVLYRIAASSHKDAIMDIPEYYHSAFIYSQLYSFYSPVDSGRLKAMIRDLGGYRLADVSFAVSLGCLVNDTGLYESWMPSEQIYPISSSVKVYVESKAYKKIEKDTAEALRYSIDWAKYRYRIERGDADEL